MAYYLDTSALVKLVCKEAESESLYQWALEVQSPLLTSDLARTELIRAVRRVDSDQTVNARILLDSLTVLRMPTSVFDAAARIEPNELRSLDALHLAVALELGDSLDAMVVYDKRLAEAAAWYGIVALSPGYSSNDL